MSVFGSIMSKIFGHSATQANPPDGQTASATPSAFDGPAATASASTAAPGSSAASGPAPSAPSAAAPPVDVGAILSDMAAKSSQPLNYKTSIVDLMKLLGLDSSLENRKSLASELHYSGDQNDSASMNVWLHKQVMDKLAENGGKIPADLRS